MAEYLGMSVEQNEESECRMQIVETNGMASREA
jgi:hypothetical protein